MAKRGKNTGKNTKPVKFGETLSEEEIARRALKERAKGRSHVWRNTIIIFILVAALSCVISLRGINLIQNVAGAVNEMISSNDDQPGREEAIRNVNEWLTDDSTPFPDGIANLQWVDATHVGDRDNASETEALWSHRFTFTDLRTGETRTVAQLVSVSGDVAAASGNPSILPGKPAGSADSSSSAPDGYPTLTQSNSLTNAIQQWAKAYVGENSDSLTVLVADPNADHGYQSAGLGTFENVTLNWAVWTHDPEDANAEPEEDSGWGAVSVTVSFTPVSETREEDDPTSNASTTLTLLVENPGSGSARVVDWGADCDLDALSPYAQAVDRADVTSNDDEDEDARSANGKGVDAGSDEEEGDAGAQTAEGQDAEDAPTDTGAEDASEQQD